MSRSRSYQTLFLRKCIIFPFFVVKLGHFMVTTSFFHLLQTLKLNSKNRKTKKNRVWQYRLLANKGLLSQSVPNRDLKQKRLTTTAVNHQYDGNPRFTNNSFLNICNSEFKKCLPSFLFFSFLLSNCHLNAIKSVIVVLFCAILQNRKVAKRYFNQITTGFVTELSV